MDSQNQPEQTLPLEQVPQAEQTSQPEPASSPKQAKKQKYLPIAIAAAILVIGGLGFGGFKLWQSTHNEDKISHPENKHESDIQSPEEVTESDIEEAEEAPESDTKRDNTIVIPTAQAEDEKTVINTLIQIEETIHTIVGDDHIDSRRIEKIEGGIIYKDSRLNVATALDKSFRLDVQISNSESSDLINSDASTDLIKSKFQSLGFQEYGLKIEDLPAAQYNYKNNKNNIACSVTLGDPYTVYCGDIRWISNEKINLVNSLYEALKASFDANKLPQYISASTKNIENSSVSPYQTIDAFGTNYGMSFYRKGKDSKWIFAFQGQQGPSCNFFNTKELKDAFADYYCFDEKNQSVQVAK